MNLFLRVGELLLFVAALQCGLSFLAGYIYDELCEWSRLNHEVAKACGRFRAEHEDSQRRKTHVE